MLTARSDNGVYRKRFICYQALPESHLAVLHCFKASPEKRLQTEVIEVETQMNRRTVQRALVTLTQDGFLQARGQGPARRYQWVV